MPSEHRARDSDRRGSAIGERLTYTPPGFTVVWKDSDGSSDTAGPDEHQLVDLARALGRLAAYRTLQQTKNRQSSMSHITEAIAPT